MTRLQDLYSQQQQSPWLDNLKRGWITSGELAALGRPRRPRHHVEPVDLPEGDRGQRRLRRPAAARWWAKGTSIDDTYWDLVTADIRDALAILRPVYDESDGLDGFVSVEVAPSLARDTAGTIASARHLHGEIDAPNLYVKIPGTAEGVPAIHQMISEGAAST